VRPRREESGVSFRPGFRLSEIDVGILILGVVVPTLIARFHEPLALFMFFAVAHFFLFCNVLRMSRSRELTWAALFVLLAGGTLRSGFPPFGIALWVMLAVTVVLAIVDMSRPSYHGIFWQRLNPGLPQWWEANRKGPA